MSETGFLILGIILGYLCRFARSYVAGWTEGCKAADSKWVANAGDPANAVECDGRFFIVQEVSPTPAPIEDDYPHPGCWE